MDPIKLREKAEKLLAKAREEERKQKDKLNAKISGFVLEYVKNSGYVFDSSFADGIKKIVEASGVQIKAYSQDQ